MTRTFADGMRVTVFVVTIGAANPTAVLADHITSADVDALLETCRDATHEVMAELKAVKLRACINTKWKGKDEEACRRYYRDFDKGNVRLDPPLPVCVDAWQAEKHYKSDPG